MQLQCASSTEPHRKMSFHLGDFKFEDHSTPAKSIHFSLLQLNSVQSYKQIIQASYSTQTMGVWDFVRVASYLRFGIDRGIKEIAFLTG